MFAAQWLAWLIHRRTLCLVNGTGERSLAAAGVHAGPRHACRHAARVAALLWIVISVSIRDRSDDVPLQFRWLSLTMTGSAGVSTAGDLVSISYALVSIPALWLPVFFGDGSGKPSRRRHLHAFAILRRSSPVAFSLLSLPVARAAI